LWQKLSFFVQKQLDCNFITSHWLIDELFSIAFDRVDHDFPKEFIFSVGLLICIMARV